MSTEQYTEHADMPTTHQRRSHRQWWVVVTTLLAAALFSEAIFAGAMLSGVAWGRTAHHATAVAVLAAAWPAGLVAIFTLRAVPRGRPLGLGLLALAVVASLQTSLGALSAHGTNVMWLHVPAGVALVGFAIQAAAGARRLGGD